MTRVHTAIRNDGRASVCRLVGLGIVGGISHGVINFCEILFTFIILVLFLSL